MIMVNDIDQTHPHDSHAKLYMGETSSPYLFDSVVKKLVILCEVLEIGRLGELLFLTGLLVALILTAFEGLGGDAELPLFFVAEES